MGEIPLEHEIAMLDWCSSGKQILLVFKNGNFTF